MIPRFTLTFIATQRVRETVFFFNSYYFNWIKPIILPEFNQYFSLEFHQYFYLNSNQYFYLNSFNIFTWFQAILLHEFNIYFYLNSTNIFTWIQSIFFYMNSHISIWITHKTWEKTPFSSQLIFNDADLCDRLPRCLSPREIDLGELWTR